MFTGLIQKIGTVTGVRPSGSGAIIRIDTGELSKEISIGDSVAVNGVCLTATGLAGSIVDFDASGETLKTSTASSLKTGGRVNLELALSATGRLGGHIVQGHVDGIGEIKRISEKGGFYELSVSAGRELMSLMVKKGSVSVNGISLTVASITKDDFTVAVIPVTWRDTTLQYLKAGDKVNIEADLIVKTVKSQLEQMLSSGGSGSLTVEKLKEMGY
jgi:riboflavin synthase